MSELTKNWIREFQDKETRHIYAENFLNTYIATQLKVLREDREWTQQQLAEQTGMKQERISVLEDVNYESWTINTLKRFARAFDLRLSIKFESFGSLLSDYDGFSRETLKRPSFDKDPAFHSDLAAKAVILRAKAGTGKTYQMLRALNTASRTADYGFRGDPAQAKFNFMYQSTPTIDQLIITHRDEDHLTITVDDFKRANLPLAYFASRNVAEKEAA